MNRNFSMALAGLVLTANAGFADEQAEVAAKYNEKLAALYTGTYTAPSLTPVAPKADQLIWFVTIGLNIEPADVAAKNLEEAAAKLGWRTNVFDGQFDTSIVLTGIEQALAAGANGIIIWATDCAAISTGVSAANAAGVPIVAIESEDCTQDGFTHIVRYGQDNMDFLEFFKGWGRAQAVWTIAKTDAMAKTLLTEQIDLSVTRAVADGWREEFAECPTCTITHNIEFVGADFGPALQSKIEQALIQYPDANSIIPAYDAVMTSGGATALLSAGKEASFVVAGGEGSSQGIEQITSGLGMQMCVGLNSGNETYAALDAVIRLQAGMDPLEATTGIGYQVCDKSANLPADGGIYTSTVEYKPVYYAAWGVQ